MKSPLIRLNALLIVVLLGAALSVFPQANGAVPPVIAADDPLTCSAAPGMSPCP